MKVLLLAVLLTLVVSLAFATRGSISNSLFEDDVNDDVKDIVDDEEESVDVKEERKRNPCLTTKCKRGEVCVLNRKVEAKCICTPDCSFYVRDDSRYKVCSTKNDTYETECHLDRDHCLCKRKQEGCSKSGTKKVQLEYYGECRAFKTCTDEEAVQFPQRMKLWLYVVMEELDRRSEIEDYKEMLDSAKEDSNHSMAAIWKFCDLDKDPQDRSVSRRELQYMVRTLKALEHCLVPFLDICDANDDRHINLVEWGDCLGVGHEKITDKCRKISKKGKKKKN